LTIRHSKNVRMNMLTSQRGQRQSNTRSRARSLLRLFAANLTVLNPATAWQGARCSCNLGFKAPGRGCVKRVRCSSLLMIPVSETLGEDKPTADEHQAEEQKECLQLLKSAEFLKEGDARFEPLTAGFANHVWATKGSLGQNLVVKLYTDLVFLRIDREAIGAVDVIAGDYGVGPRVLLSTPQGLVMDRVDGYTLEEKDMHKDDFGLLKSVAAAVAKLHRLPIPKVCQGTPMLWRSIEKMLQVARRKPELWPQNMDSIEVVLQESKRARAALKKCWSSLVLGHGDLKPSNLMFGKDRKVSIIDFELGGPNYRGFDLMKIFRTAKNQSDTSMKYFLDIYSESASGPTSEVAKQKLLEEVRVFEPLTWLEAACFFLAMPQFKPELTSNWHSLAVDRWKKYQETKCVLL